MSRQTETLLGSQAWNTGTGNEVLNPLLGGQFGWATNPGEWLSAQAYVPSNLIPIALRAPKFFELMPNSEKWTGAFKVLWEKHARTIEGLKAGLTVDDASNPFGGGGELFENYVDVKRERSTLSVGLVDKYGNVWQNFLERWITYGLMHPETKVPLIATLAGELPSDWLADQYGGTVGFIQPDPMGRRCERMWICTNIWPKSNGPVEGKLDKTSALSPKELSIDFSSLTFINEGTRVFGQELLSAINKTYANPQLRESFITEISADLASVEKGYSESVTSVAASRVGDLV